MVKQSSLIAVALAGLFAAAPTIAQDYTSPQATTTQTTEVITVRPTERAQKRFYMPRQDVAEVRGEYLMEDGRTAMVNAKSRRLIVDFDNRVTELNAVGAYVFESERDDMTLVYGKDSFGDDMIVLSYIPQNAVAGLPQKRVRLSSR